jgi:hypothetical protein
MQFFGTEEIDGKKTNKYKYKGMYIWRDPLTAAPVKRERVDSDGQKHVYNYKNVVVGVPPEILFEMPPDYQITDQQLAGLTANVVSTIKTTDGKEKVQIRKVAARSGQMRFEFPQDSKEHEGVVIVKNGIMYLLNAQKNTYREEPMIEGKPMANICFILDFCTFTPAALINNFSGIEEFGGKKAWKYVIKEDGMTFWRDEKTQAPIRILREGKHDVQMFDYKDVVIGIPPDSLFEIPAGYTKVEK